MVYGGEGLARAGGKVVLTPFVMPGETVQVETVQESKNLVRAMPGEILKAAPERVEAPCPYFGGCGGCHYQFAPYEMQTVWKRSILEEVLLRVGKLTALPEIGVVTGPSLGYRNRVRFHVADQMLGFHMFASHELCPVRHCLVAAEPINAALTELRRMAHQPRFPSFLEGIELFTNGEQVQINVARTAGPRVARGFFDWCVKQVPGAVMGVIEYPAAGFRFRVSGGSFFQVNRFLIDDLAALALPDEGGSSALDLYAGVGLFALPLAGLFADVAAVESVTGAARDLRENASRAGVRVRVARGKAEAFLAELTSRPDFVIADPPRTGLGKKVTQELVRLSPPRLVIVSCDPATLARDLNALTAGGYRLDSLTMVDLFPQTYHIEAVAKLSR